MPAFGFFGSALDLDQWRCPSGLSEIAVEDGVLTMHKLDWLWHPLAPMDRMEVVVEFPSGYVDDVELAFAPDVNSPNTLLPGTMLFSFRADEVSARGGKITRRSAPIADPGYYIKKATVYRFFYDRAGGRLTIFRNEAKFMEMDLGNPVPVEGNNHDGTGVVPGICLKQFMMSNYIGLRISRLEVGPWDGVLPTTGPMAAGSARLKSGKNEPVTGKLESISTNELRQAGKATLIEAGMSVRFVDAPEGNRDIDCLLVLGDNGQFKARVLEIDGDVVTCTPAFGAAKEIPFGVLEEIVFPAKDPPAPPGDALLFKDGDELRGGLLEATSGAAVRWQMPDQREVTILPGLIAGVRFQREPKENADRKGILELRNGDRLRGEMALQGEADPQFKDSEAGTFRLAAGQLWKFYPTRPTGWCDGSIDAAKWAATDEANAKAMRPYYRGETYPWWIYLDGSYLSREFPHAKATAANLRAPVEDPPEIFEVSFNITNFSGGGPGFGLRIGDFLREDAVDIQYAPEYSQYNLTRHSNGGSRTTTHTFWVKDPNFEPRSRLSVCARVDAKAGTVDLYLDGNHELHINSMPGMGRSVYLQARQTRTGPMILSDIRIGASEAEGRCILLKNGDVMNGVVKEVRDNTLVTESDLGRLDVSFAQVEVVQFGGDYAPVKAAGRVRLRNGAAIHLASFHCNGTELTGKSDVLGDVKIPATALSELIFDPLPLRTLPPVQELPKPPKAP